MAELCSPLPLGFLPERGSIPAAGQQPASVVGLSPTAPAWRTEVGDPGLVRAHGDKRLSQDILRDRQGVRRIRGGCKPADLLTT